MTVDDTERQPTRTRRPNRRSGALFPQGRAPGMTASAIIYRELRADIVSMRRKPGEPILEKEIAQQYGVSRTPVHEAVLRIADEGLIDIFPQSGTFVARIPVAMLPEAIVIRRVLEEAAARFAAEKASPAQIRKIRATIEQQREMDAEGDREGFHQADEAFHAAIAEASGYPGIWSHIQQVKVQVDRYRRLTLPIPGRMAKVIAEHRTILTAIENHDPAEAARMMNAHLETLSSSIGTVQNLDPDYFYEQPANPKGSE